MDTTLNEEHVDKDFDIAVGSVFINARPLKRAEGEALPPSLVARSSLARL